MLLRLRCTTPLLALLLSAGCGEPEPAFTRGLLPVNGTELYVERVGTGDPVLVVHGGPLLEHGYLRDGLLPLTETHELVFFDQRLSGRSSGTVDSASVRLDSLVADMEAIREALGLPRIHILGHSWGGLLAVRYAILHPDRVVSLVLVSPMAASASLWREEESEVGRRLTPEHQAEAARLREAPGVATGDTAAIAALLRHAFRLQFHDPEAAASLPLTLPTDYLERSRQFGFMMPDLSAFDFHGDLAAVTAPALIVFGGDEPGAELGGRALVEALPASTLVTIPDTGHFSFLESPAAFFAQVRPFLASR